MREVGFLIGLLLLLGFSTFGCVHEYSSTSHYSAVPQVNCVPVVYKGHMMRWCCQRGTCWFAN
jgi:hypothetical protein